MLTVTISAPLAAIESRMTSKLVYLPVPTMSRELNARPPITNWSFVSGVNTSASLHHADDLHDVVLLERHIGDLAAFVDVVAAHHDDRVVSEPQVGDDGVERQAGAIGVGLSVQLHTASGTASRGKADPSLASLSLRKGGAL